MPDLYRLERPRSPNTCFSAPAGVSTAMVDIPAPEFAVSAQTLFEVLKQALVAQPRTTILQQDPAALTMEAEQRTALIRFRDSIYAQVLDRGDSKSSLMLYSRSNVGYSDLGTNRRRVMALLAEIVRIAPPVS